ncbi:hypothetical protein D9M68_945120 [compost metagenome]
MAEQSPLPLKIMGIARLSGNDSIIPKKSRPQLRISGGFHCSQLWRAATKAPNTASKPIRPAPTACAPRPGSAAATAATRATSTSA